MTTTSRLIPPRARRWLRSHGGALGSVVAVATDADEFVLTYDDGPEPGGTDAVLSVLAERRATATFFVLMTRVRAHRPLLADVMAAGHEIALHGPDHRAISRMSRGEIMRRTGDAKAELEDAAGRKVKWFRPPYGLQSMTSFRAITALGLTPVLWGPTALDSREAATDERLARALQGAGRGSILLSHDAYAGTADGGHHDRRPEIDRGDLARRVLDGYAARGLKPRSLSDALASGNVVRGIWFKR